MSLAPSVLPLAITMGDPCGIGPEIIAKAHARGRLVDCLVVGDAAVLARAARAAGLSVPVRVVQGDAELRNLGKGVLSVLEPNDLPAGLASLPWGQEAADAGRAAAQCIGAAVTLVQTGRAAGIVTAPLHKGALHASGVRFPGHTEMLQALFSEGRAAPLPVRMMLANEELRVVLVTIHLSLRKALDLLDVPLIVETIRQAHSACVRLGISRPRIAVAGVNPHAGEGGLFGAEEQELVSPAIAQAKQLGFDARGPFAPDTVFMRARNAAGHPGEFDIVVAMTHDHGLIPVKYLGVEQGVNVTLGLPLVRTSPDHGTAFDIAGLGLADPASFEAAVRLARLMSA
jgi:4-hydroxythreonine-4-phosphate dehydrogenase